MSQNETMTMNLTTDLKTKIFILIFALTSSQALQASSITVKKAKGKQAIVESSAVLEEGQTYELQSDVIAIDAYSTKSQSRRNSFQIGAQFQSSTGSSAQENRISVDGRYGWNFEIFEVGPTLSFNSVDLGAGAESDFFAGGYADYNVQKNRAPVEFIFGPTVSMEFGSKQLKSGGSASLFNANIGGFLTWYLNQSTVALRTEAGFQSRKIATTTTDSTLTGFSSKLFLVFYF